LDGGLFLWAKEITSIFGEIKKMRKTIIFLLILFFLSLLCFGEPNNISEELYNSVHFAENGNDIVVELVKIKNLLGNGANPNWINSESRPAMGGESILSRHVDLVSYYAKDPNTIQKGVQAIKLLFNHGAKIQYCDRIILFSPIAAGKYEIVALLLENGVSASAKIEGMQAIEWAAHYGSDEVYNVLIEHGAKPLTQKEKSLYHFIHLARDADTENIAKMDMLLKDGININDKNSRGEGAITEAVSFAWYDAGRYVMVNYLIEKGVDINRSHKVDGVNQTALHAAVYGTHFTLNNDISKYEKEESRNRLENAQFYCRKVLEDLIRAGAHISARDEYERTPLHIAAKYNNLVAAEILIKAGAKLMDKDSKGKTPLDYAESAEMIKLLKDQGAKEIP